MLLLLINIGMENETYYIKNVSFSQVKTMLTDPGRWQSGYLLGQWDNTTTVAATVWNVAHKYVEYLLKTKWDQNTALIKAYKCIYNWPNNKSYYIDPDSFWVDVKELKFEEILSNFRTKEIKFWKSSMEILLKKVKGAIDAYLSEKILYWDVVSLEQSMEFDITDTILDRKFVLPVPMKAIADQVCRLTEDRYLIDSNNEQITVPAGSLYLEDTKFKDKFSEMDSDNPLYFFQAYFLYYTSTRQYWESPKFITFREIKTSKNRDGSSQQQTVTIMFEWDEFEMGKTDFWRYMLAYFDRVQYMQDADVMFNCFTLQPKDAVEAWKKQKAFYRNISVDQVKTHMSISNRSWEAGNNFSWHEFNLLDKWQEVDAASIEWVITIEDEIRAKMLEYWIPIQYEKTNKWFAFDQALFTPGRGVEMKRIENKIKEVQQATGYANIRIQAPVPWTKFIWIEFPKQDKDRKFLPLDWYKVKKRGLKIPIWKWIDGKVVEIDLSDSNNPHLLVAGKTWAWKSEFLNVIIDTLQGRSTIAVCDPKMVEFAWADVDEYVTHDPDIYNLLRDAKKRMMVRYALLRTEKVKDIDWYNKKFPKEKLMHHTIVIDEVESITGNKKFIYVDENDNIYFRVADIPTVTPYSQTGKPLKPRQIPTTKLPFGNEILDLIWSITKLWRWAWIHIILATQRPSVQVIDGQIKANIATRVCFSLWSTTDSQVVIDENGAEKLQGKWDMLFKHNWECTRLQSYYIKKD